MPNTSDEGECPSCSGDTYIPHPIFELCRTKRFDEALQICRGEIADNPSEAGGYGLMAAVLRAMGNPTAALPYRNKVVELEPGKVTSHYALADLLYDMGDYAAAIVAFTRTAELDDGDFYGPASYLYRADCHRRLGNYEAAIADCQLVPDDFDFPGFLGYWEGTKHHLLAEIERERGKS
jgi:tetratricopeptide (TPR) repeat protein